MLDDFDHRRRIEAGEALVAIGEGALEQGHTVALALREAIETEAVARHLEIAGGGAHADDPLELPLAQQLANEAARAAAEIEHATRARFPQHLHHALHPLVVQAQRLFQGLQRRRGRPVIIGCRRIVELGQPLQGEPGQPPAMLEIAPRDQFALRMLRQPAFALPQQLVDLVIADPIVLLVVEHGDEDIEVGQELRQRHGPADGDVPVARGLAVAVEDRRSRDLVAQRREQPNGELQSVTAVERHDAGGERDGLRGQFTPCFRAATHRRAEHPRQRDAQERRSRIGPIVDVLRQRPALGPAALAPPPAHEGYRIDVQDQRRRTTLFRRFGIEHMRRAETDVEALRPLRMLAQQKSEIGGGALDRGQGQQHETTPGVAEMTTPAAFRWRWRPAPAPRAASRSAG